MAVIGGTLGYRLLRLIAPPEVYFSRKQSRQEQQEHERQRSLAVLWGPGIWDAIAGKTVIDFGCGEGFHAIEMAKHAARRVIGIDIRQKVLDAAMAAAKDAGVADRCLFATDTNVEADLIFSSDAFEHFSNPKRILEKMATLLSAEGSVWIRFGPPWYHPHGGHGLSVFPWAHLIFSEYSLMRWRSDYRNDGAMRFNDREDGLSQMTVVRFERLVRASGFRFEDFELMPIRGVRFLSNRITREFLTSSLRCRLVPVKCVPAAG